METNNDNELIRYINLKLAALGQPTSQSTADPYFLEIAGPLLRNYYQKDQLLGGRLCPADARIQAFLDSYLSDVAPGGRPACPLPLSCSIAPAWPASCRFRPAPIIFVLLTSIPIASRRASCTIPRATAAPPKASSISSKAACPFPPTRSPFPNALSRHCWPPPCTRRRRAGAALHRRPGQTRSGSSSRCCCGRSSAPPPDRSREDHGDPLLRARQPGQQSRFRRRHLRQRRRSLPSRKRRRARRRALERPHRLRDPRAASRRL